MPESLKLSVFIRKKKKNDCMPQLIVWCASSSEGKHFFCMSLDRQTDRQGERWEEKRSFQSKLRVFLLGRKG